jgi:hypothetical protein
MLSHNKGNVHSCVDLHTKVCCSFVDNSQKLETQPGMVVHIYHLSPEEAKGGAL